MLHASHIVRIAAAAAANEKAESRRSTWWCGLGRGVI